MVPDVAVPLTGLGREVLQNIYADADQFVEPAFLGDPSSDRAADTARRITALGQASSDRLDESDRLGEYDM